MCVNDQNAYSGQSHPILASYVVYRWDVQLFISEIRAVHVFKKYRVLQNNSTKTFQVLVNYPSLELFKHKVGEHHSMTP